MTSWWWYGPVVWRFAHFISRAFVLNLPNINLVQYIQSYDTVFLYKWYIAKGMPNHYSTAFHQYEWNTLAPYIKAIRLNCIVCSIGLAFTFTIYIKDACPRFNIKTIFPGVGIPILNMSLWWKFLLGRYICPTTAQLPKKGPHDISQAAICWTYIAIYDRNVITIFGHRLQEHKHRFFQNQNIWSPKTPMGKIIATYQIHQQLYQSKSIFLTSSSIDIFILLVIHTHTYIYIYISF